MAKPGKELTQTFRQVDNVHWLDAFFVFVWKQPKCLQRGGGCCSWIGPIPGDCTQIEFYFILGRSTALHCTVLYCTVLYITALYSTVPIHQCRGWLGEPRRTCWAPMWSPCSTVWPCFTKLASSTVLCGTFTLQSAPLHYTSSNWLVLKGPCTVKRALELPLIWSRALSTTMCEHLYSLQRVLYSLPLLPLRRLAVLLVRHWQLQCVVSL